MRKIFDHGAERRQSPPFTSFVQPLLVVGWQNKHDEGKEGTAGGEDREVEISDIRNQNFPIKYRREEDPKQKFTESREKRTKN